MKIGYVENFHDGMPELMPSRHIFDIESGDDVVPVVQGNDFGAPLTALDETPADRMRIPTTFGGAGKSWAVAWSSALRALVGR
jgi:hypothetical protein